MVLETPYAPSQPMASERLRTAVCVSAGKIPIVPVWLHDMRVQPQRADSKRRARLTQYQGLRTARNVQRLTATDGQVSFRFLKSIRGRTGAGSTVKPSRACGGLAASHTFRVGGSTAGGRRRVREGKERQRKERERHDTGESEHFCSGRETGESKGEGMDEDAGQDEPRGSATRPPVGFIAPRSALGLSRLSPINCMSKFVEHACPCMPESRGRLGAVARRAPERSGGH